jgi:hypothetical protein
MGFNVGYCRVGGEVGVVAAQTISELNEYAK